MTTYADPLDARIVKNDTQLLVFPFFAVHYPMLPVVPTLIYVATNVCYSPFVWF